MSSSLEFVEHVCARMQAAGEIRYKKMFGEYGIYCDEKFLACVSDDQLFVKITAAGEAVVPGCPTAPPYEGASQYFLIAEPDDAALLARLIRATCDALPAPKPKKPRRKQEAGK